MRLQCHALQHAPTQERHMRRAICSMAQWAGRREAQARVQRKYSVQQAALPPGHCAPSGRRLQMLGYRY
jgi:hypothetical protein